MMATLLRLPFSIQQSHFTILVILLVILNTSLTSSSSTNHKITSSPTCTMSKQEYDALYALYNSTNGSSWSNRCNEYWIFTSIPDYTAPCNGWFGVHCNQQCQVTKLSLQNCQLSGTITAQLGSISSLQTLFLFSNNLVGSIPSQLGLLTNMTDIDFDTNFLTGTIPSQLGLLTRVQYLYLYTNYLTGPIPSQLGNMVSLTNLDLEENRLTGPIPSQFASMVNLEYLLLYSNLLTNTIPSHLGLLTNMQYLHLNSNKLCGTIPSHLAKMTKLVELDLDSNLLTGAIPSQLGSLTKMQFLYLFKNFLSNTIPSQLGSMVSMATLDLDTNKLRGTIPSQLGLMTSIKNIYLYSNSLTGTIPSQLGECKYLGYLSLQDNNLQGLVPSRILALQELVSINLANNRLLGGNITSLFQKSSNRLSYIVLSSMQLTGSLPSSIFSLPSLNTLVLSSNCITGTLPSSVCASSVSSLILDGIGVGSSCKSSKLSSFYGTIPSCLFSMSNLSTLSLIGNGLTGSLVPEVLTGNSLSSLSLANNRLTGAIPTSIQTHVFITLDLSSNKLSGTLASTYEPPLSSLTLTVNRLSGNWPSALEATNSTVDVLDGNLFGCPVPRNDVSSRVTSCGSVNLENPTILWLALSVVFLVVAFSLTYSKARVSRQVLQLLSEWWQSYCRCLSSVQVDSNDLYHTRCTMRFAETTCTVAVIVSPMYVLVAMTSYLLMKLQYTGHTNSTYQVQYLYTATSAYLVGVTPTVLVVIYVTLSGIATTVFSVSTRLDHPRVVRQNASQRVLRRIETPDESIETNSEDLVKSVLLRVLVGLVVSALAIAVNFGFVQIVYSSETSHLGAVNFSFAVIKSLLSSVIVPLSAKLLPKTSRQAHIVLMTTMVNAIGPGLAVLLSSPLCLYDYFNPRTVSVSYQYPQENCGASGVCASYYLTSSTVITPQWFYSYQCSSSYLTSYLPNFTYLYIITGVVTPLLNLLVMLTFSWRGLVYEDHRQKQSEVASGALKFIGDKIWSGKVFYVQSADVTTDSAAVLSPLATSSSVEMSVLDQRTGSSNESSRKYSTTAGKLSAAYNSEKNYDVEVASLMRNLCVDTTLLLTFGLASPVLAVILSSSIIVNTMLWRLALGRYMSIVTKAIGSRACFDNLERAFEDEWRCLPKTWWISSMFTGMFWGLSVYDMIGDKEPRGAIVAAVLMMIWCSWTFISLQWLLSTGTESNSDTVDTKRFHSTRCRIHEFSSSAHLIVWRHVFRVDSSSTRMDDKSRSVSVNEPVSPL